LINNGLISYFTGIHDFSILKSTGLIGHRFENWFLNEIQAWMDGATERHQISFWRTAADAEVDFVVTLGTQIIPFEITYNSKVSQKKLNNLRNFMKKTPKCAFGVICYMGPFVWDEEERLLFLPAWMM